MRVGIKGHEREGRRENRIHNTKMSGRSRQQPPLATAATGGSSAAWQLHQHTSTAACVHTSVCIHTTQATLGYITISLAHKHVHIRQEIG